MHYLFSSTFYKWVTQVSFSFTRFSFTRRTELQEVYMWIYFLEIFRHLEWTDSHLHFQAYPHISVQKSFCRIWYPFLSGKLAPAPSLAFLVEVMCISCRSIKAYKKPSFPILTPSIFFCILIFPNFAAIVLSCLLWHASDKIKACTLFQAKTEELFLRDHHEEDSRWQSQRLFHPANA